MTLYDQLYALRPNPWSLGSSRLLAVAELQGPIEGLNALAEIDPASLENYQPYHAARAYLPVGAGRRDEAPAADHRTIELATNTIERDFLVRAARHPLKWTTSPKVLWRSHVGLDDIHRAVVS